MAKYQCPECEAILKRDGDLTGKKLRCPKCETVFKAKPMREEGDAAKKPVAAKKKAVDDDDDEASGGTYGVIKEEVEEPKEEKGKGKKKKEKEVHYGTLRDKFEKSKRGPAMSRLVKPSNWLMMEGILVCLCSLIMFMWSLWPFIFSEDSLGRDRVKEQVLFALLAVVGFVLGGFMCFAASSMHELKYYQMVWAGCIVGAIPPLAGLIMTIVFGLVKGEMWGYPFILLTGFVVGIISAFQAMASDEVKDGFQETIDKEHELKNT